MSDAQPLPAKTFECGAEPVPVETLMGFLEGVAEWLDWIDCELDRHGIDGPALFAQLRSGDVVTAGSC